MTRYQEDPSEYTRLDDPRTATQGPRPVANWARGPAAKPANREPMTARIVPVLELERELTAVRLARSLRRGTRRV